MAEQSTTPSGAQLPSIDVVGLHGGAWFGPMAGDALRRADVLVGAARLQADLPSDLPGERIELFDARYGGLDRVIDLIEERRLAGQRVCMLASGDPGFFGIERLLVGRFGPAVEIHPAPSSIALAFARAKVNWDDAAVVSCHGRSLDRALPHILNAPKVAVLVSPSCPPEAVGQALVEARACHQHAIIVSRLGQPDESVIRTDLVGLAAGEFDPLSVLVLTSNPTPQETNAVVVWGRPESAFLHRAGMITKPEVRAVALSKLDLFGSGILWDVGAGSGSVGIEAAGLTPGLRVFAIERRADDCARIAANAVRVPVTVVEGSAPDVYDDLPDPDRVFVGGGGLPALTAAADRLRTGGLVVATFTVVATALEAMTSIGPSAQMVQIQVNRAVPIGPDGEVRLEAENPILIVWGEPT